MKSTLFVIRLYLPLILLTTVLLSAGTKKPKVLIIGDSISLGYTPYVKELLKDEAIVKHNLGNAEYTGTGLEKIDKWLGNEDWDVIHFNFGLWDLYGWEYAGVLRTPQTYAANLMVLVRRLERTEAKLIWATTTPVCPKPEVKSKLVINGKIEKEFRDAAIQVMKEHEIPVNDLYTLMQPIRGKYSVGADNVHYTPKGYKVLAEQVARIIRADLK